MQDSRSIFSHKILSPIYLSPKQLPISSVYSLQYKNVCLRKLILSMLWKFQISKQTSTMISGRKFATWVRSVQIASFGIRGHAATLSLERFHTNAISNVARPLGSFAIRSTRYCPKWPKPTIPTRLFIWLSVILNGDVFKHGGVVYFDWQSSVLNLVAKFRQVH